MSGGQSTNQTFVTLSAVLSGMTEGTAQGRGPGGYRVRSPPWGRQRSWDRAVSSRCCGRWAAVWAEGQGAMSCRQGSWAAASAGEMGEVLPERAQSPGPSWPLC